MVRMTVIPVLEKCFHNLSYMHDASEWKRNNWLTANSDSVWEAGFRSMTKLGNWVRTTEHLSIQNSNQLKEFKCNKTSENAFKHHNHSLFSLQWKLIWAQIRKISFSTIVFIMAQHLQVQRSGEISLEPLLWLCTMQYAFKHFRLKSNNFI